jgi:hypothetical protein
MQLFPLKDCFVGTVLSAFIAGNYRAQVISKCGKVLLYVD